MRVLGGLILVGLLLAVPPSGGLQGEPQGGAAAPSAAVGSGTAAPWRWPLWPRPPVLRPFDLSNGPYGRGHRGVDLGTVGRAPVRAVASGRVSHVGRINGRGTLSVLHADGVRSTYEPVDARVGVGEAVAAGAVVGVLSADPAHCAPAACLHLGARRGRVYLDPLALLGAAGVRLLPVPP